MSTRIFSDPRPTFFLADGVTPNAGGKIYFKEPGAGNTTDKAAYSDATFQVPLNNPVILNESGRPTQDIRLNGDYRVYATDENDVVLWDTPNYQTSTADAQFSDWASYLTYDVNDFVRGSNGKYYQSLSSGNSGNDPTTSPSKWVEIYFIDVWSASKTYALDDIVKYGDDLWVSQTASNLGNTPSVTSSSWRSFFEPSTDTDYQATSFRYSYFAGGIGFPLFVTTDITESAVSYETVGPSGSGADYEWLALDLIDSDAKAVEISILSRVERTAGADDYTQLSCFATSTSDSTIPSNETLVSEVSSWGGTTVTARAKNVTRFTVPLDANLQFKITWVQASSNIATLEAQITAYMR